MTTPQTQTGSVIDIVSFGYKSAIRTAMPLLKLSLPMVIIYALASGVYYQMNHGSAPSEELLPKLLAAGFLFVTSIGLAYAYYAMARYVRDLFRDTVKAEISDYWIPDGTLVGSVLLGLLYLVAIIPFGLVMLLGLILFIAPGLIIASYFGTACGMVYITYFAEADQGKGIGDALSRTVALLKGNFWRTVGLGAVMWVVQLVLSGPTLFISMLEGFLSALIPDFGASIAFLLLYTLLTTVTSALSIVLGHGGALFALNRYYLDLSSRVEQPATL